MSEQSKGETVSAQVQSRRAFVKTAAKVAVTAPAAALLLQASAKPAKARVLYDPNQSPQFGGDDVIISGDQDHDDTYSINPGDDLF